MLEKKTDPVCGMEVYPSEASAQSVYRGETYYFCSQECKQKFDKQPQKYLDRMPESQSRA